MYILCPCRQFHNVIDNSYCAKIDLFDRSNMLSVSYLKVFLGQSTIVVVDT